MKNKIIAAASNMEIVIEKANNKFPQRKIRQSRLPMLEDSLLDRSISPDWAHEIQGASFQARTGGNNSLNSSFEKERMESMISELNKKLNFTPLDVTPRAKRSH